MIAYILSIPFFLMTINTDIKEVVMEFHQLKTEQAEINFITKFKETTNPSILAYVVSVSMKQAEYSHNPYNKLQVFNTNKKVLQRLISQNGSNVHLRYVRLVVQENAPGILGYNDHIEEDKSFLKKKLEQTDEWDFLDAYIKANTSL